MFDKLKKRLNELYTTFADDDFEELAVILAETEAEYKKECEKIPTMCIRTEIKCYCCVQQTECKMETPDLEQCLNECGYSPVCPKICPKYKVESEV